MLRRWLTHVGLLVAGCTALSALLLSVASGFALWRIHSIETLQPEQAAPPGGRWVQAHDTRLYIREHGAPTAPLLILTHGTGAWSGTWASNVEALADAGYRVVAVDLPPFGFSHLPASKDYSRVAQADRLAGLVRQLTQGPTVLLGHSYGGGPAAEAAMRHPSLFSHLILLDAALGLPAKEKETRDALEPSIAQPLAAWSGLRTLVLATVGTQPAFSAFWLRQFVARKEVVVPDRVAIYQQPFRREGFTRSLGDWAYQFAFGDTEARSNTHAGFRELKVPLLLMWGELDTVTPLSQAQAVKALAPAASLTVLPGVGHIPQIEDVAQFNQAATALLRSLR